MERSETDIKLGITKVLESLGYIVTRIPVGGYRGRAKGAKTGTPDLHVIGFAGRSCWLEVKRPKEGLSPAQNEFFAKARAAGAFCERVDSEQSAVDAMRRAAFTSERGVF